MRRARGAVLLSSSPVMGTRSWLDASLSLGRSGAGQMDLCLLLDSFVRDARLDSEETVARNTYNSTPFSLLFFFPERGQLYSSQWGGSR